MRLMHIFVGGRPGTVHNISIINFTRKQCCIVPVQGRNWWQGLRDILRAGKVQPGCVCFFTLNILKQVDRPTAVSLCQSNDAILVSFENADEQSEISDFLLFFDCN
jgi:hypothetical protein